MVSGRTAAVALAFGLALAASPGASAQVKSAKTFRTTADAAKAQLNAGDLGGAAASLSALQATTPAEKYIAASLGMELAVRRNDIVAQRKAISTIIESGGAPPAELPYLNHVAGYLSLTTGAVDNALVYLTRARTLGRTDAQTTLMLADAYARRKKLAESGQLLDQLIAQQKQAGAAVPASWYNRAASWAYARKDWDGLAGAETARLALPGTTPGEWRSGIATYIEGAKPEEEAKLDLYRLMAATGGMASERDYEAYAALAAKEGYSLEAKAAIESGRSKDKLTAANSVTAPLARTLTKKAAVNLSSIRNLPGKSASAATGDKAADAGDALFANSQFAEAIPYYRVAQAKGSGHKDRVATRLGIALARTGDLDGARQALAQATGQWAQVAAYWNAWVATRPSAAASAATAAPAAAAAAIAPSPAPATAAPASATPAR